MRKQFEELHPLFDLEKDEQGEYTCVLTRVTWLGFELGKKTLLAEIDQLNEVLDERTKEWLEAIELGTYFQDAAKPLKDEVDDLKAQLNNMEQCYIGIKQEHNELIAFNTGIDRKQKVAEKTAEKYKFKVSMIADLLRDCVDQDMTLKAIKTVIDRVGES